MDQLSVLSVAYPFAPVDADPVGGAEQVLAAMDRALVAAGQRSTVVAHASSRVAGQLVAVDAPLERIDDRARAAVRDEVRRAIADRLAAGGIDVVHLHGIDFLDYLPDTSVPVVVTLHLPLGWYPRAAVVPDQRFGRICVSRSQRAGARELGVSAEEATQLAVVENGVRLDLYQPPGPAASKGEFALALGRICPEKGFDIALRAARRAGRPLVLAGRAFGYEAHERHFREEIVPQLDGARRFVGPAVGAAKRRLLAEARCLLVPSRVDETSSLVAMEALASGTPVVAFRRGALPEIVEHGRTGFLVDTEEEMAAAIGAVGELRSEDCRAAAEARFSSRAMAGRYFEVYRQMSIAESGAARGRRRSAAAPRIEVEELDVDDRLNELRPEWASLCDRDPRATPFQRPEWLLAARRHLGADARPHVLALRRGGRLIALMPLERRDDRLGWIGSGVSDYLDLVCELDGGREAAGVALRYLAARRGTWSRLDLEGLRADSELARCPLPEGWREERTAGPPSPVAPLPVRQFPPKLLYYRRRLGRTGATAWRTATEADAPELLERLFALHSARWRARGQVGVLAEASVRRFHVEAAVGLARRGTLRLYALEIDGRTIGALHGFAERGRFFFYLAGFDPAFARLSPGVLLVDHAMQEAAAEGATEFDFLRGDEDYKYAWGAVDRPALIRRVSHD